MAAPCPKNEGNGERQHRYHPVRVARVRFQVDRSPPFSIRGLTWLSSTGVKRACIMSSPPTSWSERVRTRSPCAPTALMTRNYSELHTEYGTGARPALDGGGTPTNGLGRRWRSSARQSGRRARGGPRFRPPLPCPRGWRCPGPVCRASSRRRPPGGLKAVGWIYRARCVPVLASQLT